MSEQQYFDSTAVSFEGDLIVVSLTKGNTLARSRWMWSHLDSLIARHKSIVALLVVPTGTPPPDAQARAHAVEQLTRTRNTLRRFITVIEGDTLWLNIVRVITRTMSSLSGISHASFVTDTAREGIDKALEVARTQTPARATIEQMIRLTRQTLETERVCTV